MPLVSQPSSLIPHPFRKGFTLLELMTVIVIVCILTVITLGVLGRLRGRARRAQCMANLRSLHVGAELYVQQHGAWPRIRRNDFPDPKDFANQWIDALTPHGVSRAAWICPSIQEQLQNPNYATPEEARVDYVATPFDDKPMTPHQWKSQPWFIEVGDVHGNGNLMIFTDGSISDLNTVAR